MRRSEYESFATASNAARSAYRGVRHYPLRLGSSKTLMPIARTRQSNSASLAQAVASPGESGCFWRWIQKPEVSVALSRIFLERSKAQGASFINLMHERYGKIATKGLAASSS